MLNTNQTKGLKIEPWILKAVKSAKDIVVRFYNGTNVLEIQDKNDQTIQYTFNSVYRYEGNWVMMYLNDYTQQSKNYSLKLLKTCQVGPLLQNLLRKFIQFMLIKNKFRN